MDCPRPTHLSLKVSSLTKLYTTNLNNDTILPTSALITKTQTPIWIISYLPKTDYLTLLSVTTQHQHYLPTYLQTAPQVLPLECKRTGCTVKTGGQVINTALLLLWGTSIGEPMPLHISTRLTRAAQCHHVLVGSRRSARRTTPSGSGLEAATVTLTPSGDGSRWPADAIPLVCNSLWVTMDVDLNLVWKF